MLELPFTLKIDFIIGKDKPFNEYVFTKLLSEIQEIHPKPTLKIYAYKTDFYLKISELSNNTKTNTNFYFYFNDKIKILPDQNNINLIFPLNTPDLYKKIILHKNRLYKIILIPSPNYDNQAKTEFEKIKNDSTIKNLFLQPYLTETELDKFSKNILNRQFLTCGTSWLNPIIDNNGDIFCCKYINKIGNISNKKLIDIWNNNKANEFRTKIINEKNLQQCCCCLKKYTDSFLIVDNGELEYKGNKYIFPSSINYVVSAPKVAIVGQKTDNNIYFTKPYPIFSDEDIPSLKDQILCLLG